ncbi:MAG: ATP-binding cassette domain-containing protein [Chloroflexota bacterium]
MTEPQRATDRERPVPPEPPEPTESTQPSTERTAEPPTAAATRGTTDGPAQQAAVDALRPDDRPKRTGDVPGDSIVVMTDVSRAFGDRVVVRDIDVSVTRGTIVGVIGPSGSGKTTTIRMLTGALRPTTGQIRVLDEDPAKFRRATRERIGYMPQLFTLYPDLSARENVDFVGSLFGLLWPRRRRRTREVLELLELWDVRNRRASAMSGGMQRRLELACALVHEPVLLFLDEPTAGIDPLLRAKVWDELHRLRDAGVTIFVTTQYVGDAEDCDQVALIAGGTLVALATPDELRREALGGEAISVETAKLFDATSIHHVAGVTAVSQRGPREFTATVDDSAVALPAVVEAIRAAGAEVVSAQELRPSFDDIFALLVDRAATRRAEADDSAATEPAA